ncbi:hypothetical protein BASA81_010542 [Batrachochytrium salamandrivorans]|nr:hypothetical protein BASA81_010542 [Batrachochytrium salamandrivorans]
MGSRITPGRRSQVDEFMAKNYLAVKQEQVDRIEGNLWLVIRAQDGTKETLHSDRASVDEATSLEEARHLAHRYTFEDCRVLSLIDFVTPEF